jgi:hypothetical protein
MSVFFAKVTIFAKTRPVEVDDPESGAVIAPLCCEGEFLACVCSDLLPADAHVASLRLAIENQLIAVEADMRICSGSSHETKLQLPKSLSLAGLISRSRSAKTGVGK